MSSSPPATDYRVLVSQWQPTPSRDRRFKILLVISLLFAMMMISVLSSVDVPEPARVTREDIPERIVRFIVDQTKPPPTLEFEPLPKPAPVAVPQPAIERKERERPAEPLTDVEKVARQEAEESGLLAMRQELDGLMDTSSVDDMIDAGVNAEAGDGAVSAGFGEGELAVASGRQMASGSGEVSMSSGGNGLSRRVLREVALSEPEQLAMSQSDSFAGAGRSNEEISLVFDRNKGKLYSLYNRAKRQKPGLRGRLIVEITIAPTGQVTEVDVVSSNLDSPIFEQRIVSRIFLFEFDAKASESITVIYPIEFLPT